MLQFDLAAEPRPAIAGDGRPQRPIGRWLLAANLLIAALLAALVVLTLSGSRRSAEQRARVATENLA